MTLTPWRDSRGFTFQIQNLTFLLTSECARDANENPFFTL